jgi:nucleosome binding factor SPN SPT16 subunit
MFISQRWAPTLFSRFRAREREAKKERESAKKKKHEKKRKRRARKKKARIRAFSATHSGNPVSEPKAAWQGEMQGS